MPDGRMKRERLFYFVQGWDALERLFHLFSSCRPTDNNLARDGTNREHESLVRIIGIMGFGRLVARAYARADPRGRVILRRRSRFSPRRPLLVPVRGFPRS